MSNNRIRRCVSVDDFRYFMTAIVQLLLKNGVQLLLINPFSNTLYPPCNNMPDILFYKIINIYDNHPLSAVGRYADLHRAGNLLQASRLEDAEAMYHAIINGPVDANALYVAANNITFIFVLQDRLDDALATLDKIPSCSNPFFSVVLYNKGIISHARNDEENATRFFRRAAETDKASYRITQEYRDVIAQIQQRYRDTLHYIDADQLLSENDVIDYCHPNENGQYKLYREIETCLKNTFALTPGATSPTVKYVSMNPDRYVGFKKHTFEHFRLVQPATTLFVETIIDLAKSSSYSNVLSASEDSQTSSQTRTFHRILRHPLFGIPKVLSCSPPLCDADQGRFPEFYFLRHLVPIFQEIKTKTELSGLFLDLDEVVPNYGKISVFLNDLTRWCEIPNLSQLRLIFDSTPPVDLEMRLVQYLLHLLDKEPAVYQRYRTITYWFFHESLLFGSTSHYLMFCDRMALFDLTSSCMFMLWHIDDIQSDLAKKFVNILRILTDLKEIHKKYLYPVSHRIFDLPREMFTKYCGEVGNLKEIIRGDYGGQALH